MFIAIEGPRGSSNSALARHLVDELSGRRKLPAVFLREEVSGCDEISPRAGFLKALAVRAAFVKEVLCPALEKEQIVIADHFSLSTLAYWVGIRGLPKEECHEALKFAEGDLAEKDAPYYLVLTAPPDHYQDSARRMERHGRAAVIDIRRMDNRAVREAALLHLDRRFAKLSITGAW